MCMCGKPTINGEFGYVWNGTAPAGTYPVNPPALADDDTLVYDEPGRCGGLDSHSHHVRVVRAPRGGHALLVRHGGGDERIRLSGAPMLVDALATLDTNARYWLLMAMYHAQSDAARDAANRANASWRKAAADKRIKTRKVRTGVKVWIEPPASKPTAEIGSIEA